MRWTERQRAMLREIGIPAFWPEEAEAVPAEAPAAVGDAQAAASAAPVPAIPVAVVAPAPVRAAQADVARPAGRPEARPKSPVAAPGRLVSVAEVVLGPRPDGVDAMDWPVLRTTVAGCQACALSQSRQQAVFGMGHIEADWMIVGEVPSEQEDKQGEPFAGPPGELLDRMLEAVGLTRSEAPAAQQVYVTNALKCRPPASRNPQPQEVAQCAPFLARQIALVQPRVVLAMGRLAVQALLNSSEPLGKLRGRVHQVQGVPVVVTFHPANLLRHPADKALAWDDLCLAREVLAQARAADQSPR